MNEKLKEYLADGEQLLWSGAPSVKTLDEAHKTAFIGKAVLTVAAVAAFLLYYMAGVQAGTITFKFSAIVLTLVLGAVVLLPDYMDVGKLNKAVYGMTDRRLIVVVNGYAHDIAFDKIADYRFDTDKAGQTTLMCGKSGMKTRPDRRRLNTIFGTRMSDDGSVCDRFVMYGIPEAHTVEKLMAKYVK